MTRTRPRQNTFSPGEISPLLHFREDFQRYQTGLAFCRGFVPLTEGSVTRADGTLYRGVTRDNLPARLFPFEFAANDALVLEFTNLKMRVLRYGGLVTASGGGIYELTTPYSEARLPHLDVVQDGDVILIADGSMPIQKLSRFALDNWTIAPLVLNDGPYLTHNLDEAKTIQASAATGTITLTGAGDIVDADHVGVLFWLEGTDYTSVPVWTGNTTVAVGDYRTIGGTVEAVESAFGADARVRDPHPLIRRGVAVNPITGFSGVTEVPAVTGNADAVRLRFKPGGSQ